MPLTQSRPYRRPVTTYSDAFTALAHVYLEDSWVLALWPSENELAFDLEAVLTDGHPDYLGPAEGEQYDYRRARLTLHGQVSCALSGAAPATDRAGTADLGHIDAWTLDDAGVSLLAGDWGEARVSGARVEFVLV